MTGGLVPRGSRLPPRAPRRFRLFVAPLGVFLPWSALYSSPAPRRSGCPSGCWHRTPGAFVRHAWRLVPVAHLVWRLPIWLLVGFFLADPALWRRQLAPFRRRRGVRLCSAWRHVAATSALFDSLFRAPWSVFRCAERASLCSGASRSCVWCPCVARLFVRFLAARGALSLLLRPRRGVLSRRVANRHVAVGVRLRARLNLVISCRFFLFRGFTVGRRRPLAWPLLRPPGHFFVRPSPVVFLP